MLKYLVSLSFLLVTTAQARVTQLESLDFGKVVIQKNDRVSSITLLPSNTTTTTNDIYMFAKGHSAELAFEEYPAHIQLTISDFVNDEIVDNVYGGADFILNQLLYQNIITTDSYGSALLNIGGQLSTSGDSGSYYDGYYDATVEITINY